MRIELIPGRDINRAAGEDRPRVISFATKPVAATPQDRCATGQLGQRGVEGNLQLLNPDLAQPIRSGRARLDVEIVGV